MESNYKNYGVILESSILPPGGEIEREIENIEDISDFLYLINSTQQIELFLKKSDGEVWTSYQSMGIYGVAGVGTSGYIETMNGGMLGKNIKIMARNIDGANASVMVRLQGR